VASESGRSRCRQTVEVEEILFESVQRRCRDVGIRRGVVLTCGVQEAQQVEVTLASGDRARLPRLYAWFVCVTPLDD